MPFEAVARSVFVAFAGVVVDDVQNHFDAGARAAPSTISRNSSCGLHVAGVQE